MPESQLQLVLLSSFRPSSKYRQSIDTEEAAAFLHGYLALWHPSVILTSAGPPTIGSHYEYDQPAANFLFAVPEVPNAYQPGDWLTRVEQADSLAFTATGCWLETLKNLQAALRLNEVLPAAEMEAFAGIGLGNLILEAFCDAQDHVNPLTIADFYELLRQAARGDATQREFALGQAAHRLQEARETVYPSQMYQALTLIPRETDDTETFGHWLRAGLPMSLIASSSWLEQHIQRQPELNTILKDRADAGSLDWWGGHYFDQEDAHLPLAAWLANLRRGLKFAETHVGKPLESLGRRRFAGAPTLPALAWAMNLKRTLGFCFDGGVWPHATSSLTAWRGPSGQLLESCNRKPEPVAEPATWFHLGNVLYETSLNEYVAWTHLGSDGLPAEVPFFLQCWYRLHEFAPVFGKLGTLAGTIGDIPATEQFSPPGADDFQSEYLLDLTGQGHLPQGKPDPISRFARAACAWQTAHAGQTLCALWGAIAPKTELALELSRKIAGRADDLLDQWNQQGPFSPQVAFDEILRQLSERLTSRAQAKTNGYLLLNPCGFERNMAVRLPLATTLLPAPTVASQRAEAGIDAVVTVPPLGFAWVPQSVERGTAVRVPKQTIVQGHVLQNEFMQVELNPQTGGIKAIRGASRLISRVGQQLIYGPGSTMKCEEITVGRSGHAMGELISRGTLVDAHDSILAQFQQTVRLWAGRKLLEIDIKLEPVQEPTGFPWHAFYGCRWAWRDPGTQMQKSVHGTKLPCHQSRPETPGFIELEMPGGKVAIFSGGLPFWQRHGTRMLDTVFIVPGESSRLFQMAVSVDDELPHQTEQDWLTPALITPTENGPPAAGTSGWLFHMDAPSVMVREIRLETERTVVVELQETFGYATEALLRCPHNPTAAKLLNGRGEELRALRVAEDFVFLHAGCFELLWVRVEF